MKILANNFNVNCLSFSPSFCARNGEIKRADSLMRKSRETFPMLSATYVDDFYLSTKPKSSRKDEADEMSQSLWDKIFRMRRKCDEAEKYSDYSFFDTKLMYDLSQISKNKVGNCTECSKAALATLCANGYYNSHRVNLLYRVEFINKKTGEKEYSAANSLDHSFAVTDLNSRKEQDIVIDPWLGFADYKGAAFARFKAFYGDELDDYETMHKKLFNLKKLQEGENIDFKDYEMRKNFIFHKVDPAPLFARENIGTLVTKEYPEILLDVSV